MIHEMVKFNISAEWLFADDNTAGNKPESALYNAVTDEIYPIVELTRYATGFLKILNPLAVKRDYVIKASKPDTIMFETDMPVPDTAEYPKTVLNGYSNRVQKDSLPNLIHQLMQNYDFRATDENHYDNIWSVSKTVLLDKAMLPALCKELTERERILTVSTEKETYHICIGMCLDKKRNCYSSYLFSVEQDTKAVRYLDTETFCKLIENSKKIQEYQYETFENKFVVKAFTGENLKVISQRILSCLMDVHEYGVVFTRMNRYAVQAENIPEYDLYPDNKTETILDEILQSS